MSNFNLSIVFIALFLIGCVNQSKKVQKAETAPDTTLVKALDDSIQSAHRTQDTLHIKYLNSINGYKVRVTWMPVEVGCKYVEGPADIVFKHNTGATFTIRHNLYFSDLIDFDTTNGMAIVPEHKNFSIKYPDTLSNKSIQDCVPFYFADMNFDGKKELVLVNLCKAQRFRDSLAVFAIGDNYKLLDSVHQITHLEPYCFFDSQTIFNRKRRMVTVNFSGGAYDTENRTYIYDKKKGLRLYRVYGSDNGEDYDRTYN